MSNYTPTPEAVEVAARASYESFMARMTRHFAEHGVTLPPARSWEELSDRDHETFREDATAALTAAGPHIAAEALREFAAERYEAYLTDPDLPASEQPSSMACRYRLAADDLRNRADTIEKEADDDR